MILFAYDSYIHGVLMLLMVDCSLVGDIRRDSQGMLGCR